MLWRPGQAAREPAIYPRQNPAAQGPIRPQSNRSTIIASIALRAPSRPLPFCMVLQAVGLPEAVSKSSCRLDPDKAQLIPSSRAKMMFLHPLMRLILTKFFLNSFLNSMRALDGYRIDRFQVLTKKMLSPRSIISLINPTK